MLQKGEYIQELNYSSIKEYRRVCTFNKFITHFL